MHDRSSLWCDSVLFRARKVQRFRDFFIDDSIIDACVNWHPRVESRVAKAFGVKRATRDLKLVRLVLPYIPCLISARSMVNRIFSDFEDFVYVEEIIRFTVQISWAKGGNSLAALNARTHFSEEVLERR